MRSAETDVELAADLIGRQVGIFFGEICDCFTKGI